MTLWYRAYSETLNDPKVQTLPLDAFKAWHNCLYLAAAKGSKDGQLGSISEIAFAFRQTADDVLGTFEPLISSGLLEKSKAGFVISNWAKRQFKESPSEEFYIYFIGPKSLSSVKVGHSKNPWARISNLQTGSSEKLYVIATIRTTESGDRWLADHFSGLRIGGEWFAPDAKMISLIKAINKKVVNGRCGVESYLENYVAATTDTDTDTDTDITLAKANAEIDSEKAFWDSAKKFAPASMVGKWLKAHGKEMTMAAINAGQIEKAVDPVAYCQGYFRRHAGNGTAELEYLTPC